MSLVKVILVGVSFFAQVALSSGNTSVLRDAPTRFMASPESSNTRVISVSEEEFTNLYQSTRNGTRYFRLNDGTAVSRTQVVTDEVIFARSNGTDIVIVPENQ